MSAFTILIFVLCTATLANAILGNERIVDGESIPLGRTPYLASLRSLRNVHFCGGTIISARNILTAAQCTVGRAGNSINVIVGTIQRTSGGTTYVSLSYLNHPAFNRQTLENDISIITTAAVIVMTSNVQTAYINPHLSVNDLSVHISGWGISTDGTAEPMFLQGITTRTIPNERCRSLQQPHNRQLITENKICTFDQWQGICHGDEGGAIVLDYEVIGVASWHANCAYGIPNVYERVAPHRLWIVSNMLH